MRPDESLDAFQARVTASDQLGTKLSPAAGVSAMIAFFREVPAAHCDPSDGDMLLFQWGTYDWGRGERFELNITRQFCGPSGEDDEISQLALTFLFTPDAQLRSLGQGNRWCKGPEEVEAFQGFVTSSAAYSAVFGRTDGTMELEYEYV